jgi:hypothetical protein
MKKIKKIEQVLSLYEDWKPSDIAFVKYFEWSNQNLQIVFYCQLRQKMNEWPNILRDFFELSITFKTVSSLKIDFKGLGLHQFSGFDILDISDDGFEEINFQIEDYEDDSLSFYCHEIEINKVSHLAPFASTGAFYDKKQIK